MKTGGGIPEYSIIQGPEKELLEALSLSVHGLSSVFDSDIVLPQTTVTGEKAIEQLNLPIITNEEIMSYDLQPVIIEVPDVGVTDLDLEQNCGHTTSTSDSVNKENEALNCGTTPDLLKKENEAQNCSTTPSPSNLLNKENENLSKNASGAWKEWSPGALKSKKHPLLTPRRKKNDKRSKKIDNLLQLREELVRQQIEHVKEEKRRAQEKHEMEIKLLQIEINIKQKGC